jgi:glycosyltransferase involved in cell wall biosynthesis
VSRPRVAVLTTYYRPVLGGAEAAAERLARYLARRGHAVTVLTKRTAPEHPARQTLDDVDVRRLGAAAERSGRGKWAFAPVAAAALLRDRHQYDIVCCVDYRAIGLGALLARAWTRTPVIFQAQTEGVISAVRVRQALASFGVSSDGALAQALTFPIRAMYGRADALACISHDLEREALAAGVPHDRVHYLPNPVDCDRFRPAPPNERASMRAALGLAADAVVAVFVGRLSREKGVMELLDAWHRARPDARLVVIGPPMTDHPWDVSRDARAFIEREGLGGSIRLLGGQPADVVSQWLSVADFAIQPSHFEAMGLAAAEEMAAGLPVIASNTGGFRDFVVTGETGALVPVRDCSALAAAIARFAGDAAGRARMGANARRRAEAFDERLVLEQFARLIDRLAGAR